MLTKSDLTAIRQVVREETEPRFDKLEEGQASLATRIDKVDKKFDKLFKFLDKEWSRLFKRVKHLENHLGIQPPAEL